MGFDFYVVDTKKRVVDSFYLSYNWSDLKDIWYIRNDLFNKTTDDVKEKLVSVIKSLEDKGYVIAEEVSNNPNWGYGLDCNMKLLPEKERIGVFMYHLNHFLFVAKENPGCYFINEDDLYDSDRPTIKETSKKTVS